MTTLQRIVKYVLLAQMASDAGKMLLDSLYEAVPKNNFEGEQNYARKAGYSAKYDFIKKAITEIERSRPKEVFYAIGCDGTPNYPYIVYFEFHLKNKRYQVSFHSGCSYNRYRKNGKFQAVWDRDSSQHTCMALARLVDLF